MLARMIGVPAPQVHRLPRGGAVVATSAGPVQLGCPPETIKDLLADRLEVPSAIVLPTVWFSRGRGVTLAEIEFPVYYNYFVLGRKVTFVCEAAARPRLLTILRESLFGPEAPDPLDYEPSVRKGLRADLVAEARWFRGKRGDVSDPIALDDVAGFIHFDAGGTATLADGVTVELARGDPPRFRVVDRGRVVADLDETELGPPPRPAPARPRPFAPPPFGLTVLGASHGFDPGGKTTGFVLWANRHGVLVDPPIDATDLLRAASVAPHTVDSMILTHCHADHDAGVLQKILEAGRVSLFTTPTILASFLRKVVALTGEPEERLRRLFVFRPVTIGGPLRIQGVEFRFFYTLHSIPTIGFECFFGGKSFFYSADTLYDPPRIAALHRAGAISAERRDALLAFPEHHSLVVHEAGVPPIHTPVAALAALPAALKRRLTVIHMAERDLPPDAGLRLARVGFDETIVLSVPRHPYAEALEALDALAAVDLLRDLTVERAREFLTIARRERHPAGALLVGQGEAGDRFYVIVSGEAAVARDGVVVKTYRGGDFFGETALITGQPRSADVRARTDLDVLAVDKNDFLAFLRGTDLAAALIRLARNRDLPSWDLIAGNPVLCLLGANQRTRLQAVLQPTALVAGQRLWKEGDVADGGWLLDDALVELWAEGHAPVRLGRAAFLGDGDAIVRGCARTSQARCLRAGSAFRIAAAHLAGIVEHSPALLLALAGTEYVA